MSPSSEEELLRFFQFFLFPRKGATSTKKSRRRKKTESVWHFTRDKGKVREEAEEVEEVVTLLLLLLVEEVEEKTLVFGRGDTTAEKPEKREFASLPLSLYSLSTTGVIVMQKTNRRNRTL